MSRRRNKGRRPDGTATVSIRRPEPPARLEGRAGALFYAAGVLPPLEPHRPRKMEGPIPVPEMLREYDEMMPGLGARIVDWAEDEAEHRRRMERSLMRLSWGGLWCALAVALTAMMGGIALAWAGRSAAGLIGIVTAVAGLVVIFVAGRRRLPMDRTQPSRPAV